MAQNSKTRLCVIDTGNGIPYGIQGETEFDVYQEAFDYARWVVRYGASAENMQILIASYNNPSGFFQREGSDVVFYERDFPFA